MWAVIFVLCVGCIVTANLLNAPPKSYRAQDGPSSIYLETKGVFRPGGYVDFTFSPNIESLKGYNKGRVTVYPIYPGVINVDNTVWKISGYQRFGRDWGSSMSGSDKSLKTFKITHKLNIPNDENLCGQKVVLYAKYDITYPVYAGVASGVNRYVFREKNEDFEQQVTITLGDTTLSAEELEWKEKIEGPLKTISMVLMLVGLFLGFYAFFQAVIPHQKTGSNKR